MSKINIPEIELQIADPKIIYILPLVRPWVPYEHPDNWRANDGTLQFKTMRDYYV